MSQSKICHSLEEAKNIWKEKAWNKCRIKPNQQFGNLIAIYRTLNDKEDLGIHTNIVCKCMCGDNYVKIDAGSLTKGVTTSCGCYQKQQVSKARLHDITGEKFGKLTAIERAENIGKEVAWKCLCECGKYKIVRTYSLLSGDTQSCGCLGNSKGEIKIKELLEQAKIPFEIQKTFKTCKDKQYLPFDFYINNQYIIEYDGEQHFHSKKSGYFTEDKVKIIQEHDNIKNNFCFDNNIPIIRIPYTHYNNLCLEDLLLETSKFILERGDKRC